MMAKKGSDDIYLSVGIAIINVELIFIVKFNCLFYWHLISVFKKWDLTCILFLRHLCLIGENVEDI